jgi:hypothetical protein
MSRRFLTKILTKEEITEFDYIQEIDVYIQYNSNVFIQLLAVIRAKIHKLTP